MASLYPKLDRLVAGRDLVVIGGAVDDSTIETPEGALTVRFNSDRKPADIFATTFKVDYEPIIPDGCGFVLCTMPDARLAYWTGRGEPRSRDFGEGPRKYRGELEMECVDPTHYLQLAAAMPINPLTGIIAVAMLQHTSMRSCAVYGFDFYSNHRMIDFIFGSGVTIYPRYPYMYTHSYRESIGFVLRLTKTDPRIAWKGQRSVEEIDRLWRRRMPLLFLPSEAARLARAVRDRVAGRGIRG